MFFDDYKVMRTILRDSSLISKEEAISRLTSSIGEFHREEKVDIQRSFGRVVSKDLFARIDLPSFSRSTVDGYAVKSECTPGTFHVIGKVRIGEGNRFTLRNCDETVEVDTGSMLPEGADAVVKVEDTKQEGEKVKIENKVNFGVNVGWLGSDIPAGLKVLSAGSIITAEIVGLLSSLGINEIDVYSKPRAFIISTGDELVPPGYTLAEGKVYESNIFYLTSALTEDGFQIAGTKQVKDDYDLIKNAIIEGVRDSDLVVTTGGTSAGEKDYVYRVVKELGEMIFHGVRFKPGKPTFVGKINGVPIVGLPGNMVSSIMVYRKVVRPSLERAFKVRRHESFKVEATALMDIKADEKRFTYIPVLIFKRGDDYFALPLKFDSYMIGTFSMANGYVGMQEGSNIEEGEKVEVEVTNPPSDYVIVGEEDPIIPSMGMYYPIGSVPALKMMKNGVGDLLVISSLASDVEDFDYTVDREVLAIGNGPEIGYDDWVSLAKYTQKPAVKLRYRSLAPRFLGKAKVVGSSCYLKGGERLGSETLFIVAITDAGKRLAEHIKGNKRA